MSTITAIATPNATGGISVIRISGEKAVEIADRVFRSISEKPVAQMKAYTCAYGYVFENGEAVDDVVLTLFKAPRSYTGEDVVEISCHGGIYITRKILRIILDNGAELAKAGEFTKRAFLNGKLSLTQAEAVMDIISATGNNELKYASSLHDGAIFRRIKGICNEIVHILGDLSAWADYPEEDIPEVEPQNLVKSVGKIKSELEATAKTYDYGRILRSGINTAIVGKPNVGKSTLMNCLSGFDRSIVTDIAGTTRDVVEESVKIGELTLRLSDTAGIRETDDAIEKIGVEIAYKRLEEADLIMAVFDGTQALSDDDRKLIDNVKDKKSVAIINKTDGEKNIDRDYIFANFKYCVELSAKNSEGIENLEKVLNEMFIKNDIEAEQGVIANERQKRCLENSLKSVNEALEALENGENLDAITVLLDESADCLLELTGERITESVVNEVFSRFCVGK